MYKAIFIDIDGTLRDNNKNISERTIQAIDKAVEKGLLVVLCTGRGQGYTEKISKQCHASRYIITSSGSSVYDYESKKILYLNAMDKEACKELYRLAQKLGLRFSMNVGNYIVTTKLKYFDGSEVELNEDIETFVEKNDILQCNIAHKEFDEMKNAIPYIEGVENCKIKNRHKSLLNINEPRLGDIYCDVSDDDTNKGNAIIEFCRMLNIDLKDTIAIGDDCNDIAMFNVVGYSVAMGNSSDEVKQYANEVTESNENDGVAVFLEKLIK